MCVCAGPLSHACLYMYLLTVCMCKCVHMLQPTCGSIPNAGIGRYDSDMTIN